MLGNLKRDDLKFFLVFSMALVLLISVGSAKADLYKLDKTKIVGDAYTDSNNGDNERGAYSLVYVNYYTSGIRNTFVEYDLSSLPAGYDVEYAFFEIRLQSNYLDDGEWVIVNSFHVFNNYTVDGLHWNEGNETSWTVADAGEINYNERPLSGVTYNNTPAGSLNITNDTSSGYLNFTVSSAFKTAYSAGENFTFMLENGSANWGYDPIEMNSKESAYQLNLYVSLVPKSLTLSYLNTSIRDSHIKQTSPDTNYGSATDMEATKWAVGDYTNAPLKFENITSHIDSSLSENITNITIKFFVTQSMGSGYKVGLYMAKRNWTESGVTYNNASASEAWSVSGGLGGDDVYNVSYEFSTAPEGFLNLSHPNITRDVKYWVNGSRPNYGWIIAIIDNVTSSIQKFATVNHATVGYRPSMDIVFNGNEPTSSDTDAPDLIFLTPSSNNTHTQNASYVYISISAGEPISACILENGTVNISMTVDGSTCYYNMTGQTNNTILDYRVYGNDTSSNLNVTLWWRTTINLTSGVYVDTTSPDFSWIFPTLNNNSYTQNQSWVYVNVSASENLSSCILENKTDGNGSSNFTLAGWWKEGVTFDTWVNGNNLFVASGTLVKIYNISDESQLQYMNGSTATISSVDAGDTVRAIFVNESGTRIYIAAETNFTIWDISSIDSPTYIGKYEATGTQSFDDVKVIAPYAFVSAGTTDLMILNVSTESENSPILLDSYDHASRTTDNIDVDSDGNYVYLGDYVNSGWCNCMIIVNTTNKSDIQYVSNFTTVNANKRVEAIVVDGDVAYLSERGQGVYSVNISNVSNPVEIDYIGNHTLSSGVLMSGEIPSVDIKLREDGTNKYLSVSTRYHGLANINVTNSSAMVLLDEIDIGDDSPYVDGYTEGLYVIQNTTFVASETMGIDILNTSNVSDIQWLTRLNTPGEITDVVRVGNYLYLSLRNDNVYILDVSDVSNPVYANHTRGSRSYSIQVKGDILLMTTASGLSAYNISNPTIPATLYENWDDATNGDYGAEDFIIDGDYGYAELAGFSIINLTDPTNPVKLNETVYGCYGIDKIGTDLFICTAANTGVDLGLYIMNTSNKTQPTVVGYNNSMSFYGNPVEIDPNDSTIVYTATGNCLYSWNISDYSDIYMIDSVCYPGVWIGEDIDIDGDFLYASPSNSNGPKVFNITDPTSITEYSSDSVNPRGGCSGTYLSGNYWYEACTENGVMIYNTVQDGTATTYSNTTMTVLGDYCYINVTGLSNGTRYDFRVYGNDTTGNLNVTEWRTVTVNLSSSSSADTTPPQIVFVSPTLSNNSYTSNETYIYGNASGGEALSSCILETNSTVYQEDANATACTGSWIPGCSYLYDGDFSFPVLASTSTTYSFNYSKPNTATSYAESAQLRISISTLGDHRVDIPTNCFSQDPIQFFVNDTTAGGQGFYALYCYNGTAFDQLEARSPQGDVSFYEEAMWWYMLDNNTMTVSDNYCYYNITGLSNSTTKIIRVYANDTTGNLNVSEDRWITVNLTQDLPPEYVIGSNSTNSTLTGTYILHSLQWSDDNGMSGYIFELCNGTWNGTNCLGGWSNSSFASMTGQNNWSNASVWTNTTAGATTGWRMYVNDTYGNWNSSTVFSYTSVDDTESPDLNFVAPTLANNSLTQNKTWIYFNVSATENLASCLLDNTTTNQSMTINGNYCYLNLTGLANGTSQYVVVYANDSWGNLNVTEARNITTWITPDITAPNITIFFPSNASSTTNYNEPINYTVVDDVEVDSCWYHNTSLVNSTPGSCDSNITGPWDEGLNIITVWVNDTKGNQNYSVIYFTEDHTAPDILITNPTNNSYSSRSVWLNWSSSEDTSWSMYSLNRAANVSTFNIVIKDDSEDASLVTNASSPSSCVDESTSTNSYVINANYGYAYENYSIQNTSKIHSATWYSWYDLEAYGKFAVFCMNTSNEWHELDNISSGSGGYHPTLDHTPEEYSLPYSCLINDIQIKTVWGGGTGGSTHRYNEGWLNYTNTIVTNGTFTTVSGSNNIVVYANDSFGYLNSSSVSFYVDTGPPTITQQASSTCKYASTAFNVSWYQADDANDLTVWCDINGTNGTVTTQSSNSDAICSGTAPGVGNFETTIYVKDFVNQLATYTYSFESKQECSSSVGSPPSEPASEQEDEGGGGGGGGGDNCGSLGSICYSSRECCGGFVCDGGNCSLPPNTTLEMLPSNLTFRLYPQIIEPDSRFRSLTPGSTFLDEISVYNMETNPDLLLKPAWEFTCTSEISRGCLADWCNITPRDGNYTAIPAFSSKVYYLTCKIPETANTAENCTINDPYCNSYSGSIAIWPDGYTKNIAKAVNIRLTVVSGESIISGITGRIASIDYSSFQAFFVASWDALTTPIVCLTKMCYVEGMPFFDVMEAPWEYGILYFDGVTLLHMIGIVGCAVAIFLIKPWNY